MKLVNKDAYKQFGVIMFAITLGMTMIPSSSAMMSPNFDRTANVVLGQTMTLMYLGDPADDTHSVLVTHLVKPGTLTGAVADPSGFTQSCNDVDASNNKQLTFPSAGDQSVLELRTVGASVAATLPIEIRGLDDGETVSVTFGGSPLVLITVVGTVDINGNTVTNTTFPAQWFNITSGASGSTATNLDILGVWDWDSCGYDFTQSAPTSDLAWSHSESIQVNEPVGGEILEINSAALLIAGLTTSAIWMIPVVGAVAGTAVALYKLRQKK